MIRKQFILRRQPVFFIGLLVLNRLWFANQIIKPWFLALIIFNQQTCLSLGILADCN
ncbi:MAG: hypothetical protein ACFKPT_17125 [Gloeotrichia echinulata GP01]